MKILPIGLFNLNPIKTIKTQNNNEQKTAERLDKSDYRIADYIGEISKARNLQVIGP